MSHSIKRRRRWRTFATTLALTLGSLTVPAAALADGQLDPTFNGAGLHVGTAGEGTVFANTDNRIPMVVQADGRIVVGGARGGFMTLVRYNVDGSIDGSFGAGGFSTMQFAGTPFGGPGSSGATAMTLDASGDIVVAGYGGSQAMVVARFSAGGTYEASVVCYAPHLIDYSARALTLRNTANTVTVVGYARDRHPSVAVPGTPAVMYGQRATVTLPASGNSAVPCGTYEATPDGFSLGSTGVTIDGLARNGTVTDATRAGRWYDGVATVGAADNRYIVASTVGPDGAAWVQRFTAGGGFDTATFNAAGAGSGVAGRVSIPAANLHAIRMFGTDAIAVGESVSGIASSRHMLAARITTAGTPAPGFGGAGGVALARVAGGNNTGQAFVIQGANLIIGGSANLAGRAAMGLVRLTAANGAVDPTFGNAGQTATPIGAPAINGYITGMALGTLNGNAMVNVSGRATPGTGLATIAGRYFATGAPPPPPPLPAAATTSVDLITTNSARVGGTINASGTAGTWWIEYGTTTGYGAATAAQPIAGTFDDIDVQGVLTGLTPGTVYHARLVVERGRRRPR